MSSLILALVLASAGHPLSEKIEKPLLEELSGERAKDGVIEITRFERIQASEGWHAAGEYVKSQLEQSGYTDAHFLAYPSNGETPYYTWTTPIGWKAESATLTMTSPYRLKLGEYGEMPNSLVKHSGSAEVEVELVDVGSGLLPHDYEGKDVSGKIVMAHGYSGSVRPEAIVKRGAVGIVTYFPPEVRAEHPDLVRYTAFWPRWSERESVGFGFNVSKRDALTLHRLLEKGERVVLKASVNARFYESQIETLTTTFPGSEYPEEEIILGAHLDHPSPSANDNASGAAGLVEMARALKALVESGQIEPPLRTIRFMWFSEMFGTIAYIKNKPELKQSALVMINCDMIGEDLEVTDSLFNLTRTPHSTRSYLNDVMESFMHRAAELDIRSLRGNPAPMNYRILPYSGGSDHVIFTDSSVGVPSVMLGHWPDPFHHTSQDTPEKTDPTELKRAMFVALGAALTLANAGEEEAERIAELVSSRGLARIAEDQARALELLDAANTQEELHRANQEAKNVLTHAVEREVASIDAGQRLARSDASRGYIRRIGEGLSRHGPLLDEELASAYARRAAELGTEPVRLPLTSAEREADRIIPFRTDTFTGPLRTTYLADRLGAQELPNPIPLSGNVAFEVANFMDGTRSLLAIRNAVAAEYGPLELERVRDYVELLSRAGLVELRLP